MVSNNSYFSDKHLYLFIFQYIGIQIMSTYKYGSRNLSYCDFNLPNLKWIGLKINDLEKFHFSENDKHLIQLNKYDKQLAECLKKKFLILNEFDLIEEVNIFDSIFFVKTSMNSYFPIFSWTKC
jgi:hypothetical protein